MYYLIKTKNMKKITTQLAFVLLLTIIFTSCSSSKKGQWSQEDKNRFYKEIGAVKELDNFGEYKQQWLDCYFEKCQANYSSFTEADNDEAGCTTIATNCTVELQK